MHVIRMHPANGSRRRFAVPSREHAEARLRADIHEYLSGVYPPVAHEVQIMNVDGYTLGFFRGNLHTVWSVEP